MAEPDWQLWRSFLAVLRAGSLSGAARRLRLTQPTLGRQIAALEATLGRTLFTRSTDGLRPTDTALELFPHAEAMEAAASALVRAASGAEGELRGTVRLAASEFMGAAVLPPMLARFRAEHPGVEIELSLSDRTENLLRRDADLAVRNVAPAQAALMARRIGEAPVGLFARRDYAAAHGLPARAEELAGHALIGRAEHAGQARTVLGFDPRFGFRCDSDLGLLAALRSGLGVGYCQVGVGRRDPDLVPVLPGLVLARIGVWLAMHEDLRASRRVRALFDHLARELTAYVARAA
jgi:DNA-binding transcriptional LysR family regulator